MLQYFGHAVNVFAVAEHLPDERNRINLDPEVKDFYGISVARVSTKLSSNELEMLSFW